MSTPQFGERAEPGPGDVCYRHKDRPSFTLCQRCGRTICPDCQQISAVGVLCPECVKAASPGVAQRTRRSSRRIAWRLSDPETPVVSYGIMIACAVVFVAQWLTSQFAGSVVTTALWYAPAYSLPNSVSGAYFADVSFEPWRMFTVMFTHSTGFLLHILFNMYALWLFGPGLERMLGRLWFFVLYVFAGLGGSIGVMLWVYFAPNQVAALATPTVGASGAIFGLFAAAFVAFRVQRVNATSLLVLIGINFAIGFLPNANISWQAHLGGMVFGALTMWALMSSRGPRRKKLRLLWVGGIAALIVVLALAYFIVVPSVFA